MSRKDNIIYFWKPSNPRYGFLSNWSRHPIEDEYGNSFPTCEHYFMYQKAKLFDDHETATEILEASHPGKARELGRKIKNYDDIVWKDQRIHVMRDALILKCKQHRDVKERLLSTGRRLLAEASPFDKVWGIGLSEEQALSRKQKWPGENLLGKTWMLVRDIFFTK